MRHDRHASRQVAEWGSPLHVDTVLRNELLLLSSRRRGSGSASRRPPQSVRPRLKGGRA